MSAEALIEWKMFFCAWNEYMEDCHIKLMMKYCRDLDEEEDGGS